MRVEGDIKVVREIETFIKTNTRYDNIPCRINQVYNVFFPPTVYTRRYRIYVLPFEFDIRMVFDERVNKGDFKMQDYNSQVLFMKYPKILSLLSQMDTEKFTEYSHGKEIIVEKMVIGAHDEK